MANVLEYFFRHPSKHLLLLSGKDLVKEWFVSKENVVSSSLGGRKGKIAWEKKGCGIFLFIFCIEEIPDKGSIPLGKSALSSVAKISLFVLSLLVCWWENRLSSKQWWRKFNRCWTSFHIISEWLFIVAFQMCRSSVIFWLIVWLRVTEVSWTYGLFSENIKWNKFTWIKVSVPWLDVQRRSDIRTLT